jgi:Ca2+-binding RTX toxin-like protein
MTDHAPARSDLSLEKETDMAGETLSWTFHGVVEDHQGEYVDPTRYRFNPGDTVEGHLVLSGAALVAYLAALDAAGHGSLTLNGEEGLSFYLEMPRVGGLYETDILPWEPPQLTLTSQGLDAPLAEAHAFLFSHNAPDGPNFLMSQFDADGFYALDDDDGQLHINGVWVPDHVAVTREVGGDGADTLVGGAGLSLLFGRGGDDSLRLPVAGYAWGGVGEDELIGSTGRDWLYGGFGDDVIKGGAGDDHLFGGGGADRISGGRGNDVIFGDSERQGSAADLLSGNAGDDRLYGGWGNDILRGGEGADYLNGGVGEDTADYGAAASGVRVQLGLLSALVDDSEAGGDVLVDIEHLSGSDHADALLGDSGANRLLGRGGDDYLYGGAGADRLYGGDGNDVLNGGVAANGVGDGRDVYRGGAGADRFEFTMDLRLSGPGEGEEVFARQQFGSDRVLDFNLQEDLLVFVGQRSSFDSLRMVDYRTGAGSGTLIALDNQNKVFVLGVVAGQLNDANLLFVQA